MYFGTRSAFSSCCLCGAGGASEYAKDRINSFLIDTTKVHNALKVVEEIVERRVDLNSMREAAIETAAKFSIEASSAATVKIFHSFKDEWQHKRRTRALARALAKRTTH